METSAPRVDTSLRESRPGVPEFRDVFGAEFGYVCRALRRLGVHEADLQDVAQELFMAVHATLDRYDPARPIRPWLFSFAVRYAANYRRLHRTRNHVTGEEVVEAYGADAEARDLVLRALAKLDFERRVVIVMHDMEGFGAPDIAAELGIPLNTVYSRIRLGRSELRSHVTDLQGKGGVMA